MTDYQAVLDTCVLVNSCIRDALLRQAEKPATYLPRWSPQIIDEARRTLLGPHFGLSGTQVQHLLDEIQRAFPSACIGDVESLVPAMANDPGDRHVLGAAVKCGAQTIVTFNLKHFSSDALDPWSVEVQHPDQFLIHQYPLDPMVGLRKLYSQASDIRMTLPNLLGKLAVFAPAFVRSVRTDLCLT
jgi:hypothetical protein